MRRILLGLLFLFFGAIASLAGGYLWLSAEAHTPGPSAQIERIHITPGASVRQVASVLAERQIILHPQAFRIWARINGAHTALQAGEYDVPPQSTIEDVLALLQSGKTVVHRLTIAEGLTNLDILAQINGVENLQGGVLHADDLPAEGRMLPETYHYVWGDTRRDVVTRMTADMRRVLDDAWATRGEDFYLPSREAVLILASIIEKETAVASERGLIAGVFKNRLQKGMRLQSDPTVVYVLTGGRGALGRALTRADLKIDSPYNTYASKGLPPAPIANPGRASIDAVMNPEKTNAFYFVADGSGGHVFSDTLKEHNRNVARWRKIKNAQ